MLKDNLTYGLQKYWMFRLLFIVFLAIFAQSPVADAYSDSLSSSPVNYNDQNDSSDLVATSELSLNNNRKCINELKASRQAIKHYQALLKWVLIQDELVCRIKHPQVLGNKIISSQAFPPLPTDSSPPVV